MRRAWGRLRRRWELEAELCLRLWRAGRAHAVLLALATVVTGLLPAVSTVLLGVLVGTVPAAVRGGAGSPPEQALFASLTAVLAVLFLQRVLRQVRQTAATVAGIRLDSRAREWIAAAVCGPVGVAHLEDPATRDRVALAQASILGGSIGRFVENASSSFATRLTGLALAALIGWYLSWPAAAVLVIAWYVADRPYSAYFARALDAAGGQAGAQRRMVYLRDLISTPNTAAKEARIFGLQGWFVERFTETWLPAMTAIWTERRQARRWMLPTLALVGAIELGVGAAAALAALHGVITLAALMVCLTSMASLGAGLQFGYREYAQDQALSAFDHLVRLERELAAGRSREAVGSLQLGGAPLQAVSFREVRFTYPFGGAEVLRGLELVVPAGRSLAIVGANGAGKTTLVKLLCRLYEPTSGRITVDGVALGDVDPSAWRQRVAAIFQDFSRYPFTARENVGLGHLGLMADGAAIELAARQAGSDAVVASLPSGWETVLSKEFSGGVELSGGQWQRVALARALLAVAGGAGLLILDEPTANLDVRGEAELFDRFLELTHGVTTILISHRFSTVRRADRVCVLEGGVISEQGTHDELMAVGGTYARMFAAQAEPFLESTA